MSRIVCGIFDRTIDADAALDALKHEGFARSEVDAFYLDPPGQHQLTPIGGDVHSDAGARTAGKGAALGIVIGLFAGLGAGMVVALAHDMQLTYIALGAGLGALIGAFAGTMSRLHGPRPGEASRAHPAEPRGGRMIAVLVDRAGSDAHALGILRSNGARDVRRAEGQWANGSWRDFDPRAPLAAA